MVRDVRITSPRRAASGDALTVNVGTGRRVSMRDPLGHLEAHLGRRADVLIAPPDPVDLPATHADLTRLRAVTGWAPDTSLEAGLNALAAWQLQAFSRGEPVAAVGHA